MKGAESTKVVNLMNSGCEIGFQIFSGRYENYIDATTSGTDNVEDQIMWKTGNTR